VLSIRIIRRYREAPVVDSLLKGKFCEARMRSGDHASDSRFRSNAEAVSERTACPEVTPSLWREEVELCRGGNAFGVKHFFVDETDVTVEYHLKAIAGSHELA
jgi:hypothetical protein